MATNRFISCDYSGVVLSAGALKGFYELGVMQYYHTNGYFKNAKVFAGTSIGSVIATFYSIGMTPIEILTKALDLQLIIGDDFDISNFFRDFGLYKTDRLKKFLEDIFIEKFNIIPTLLELYMLTQKHLILCSFNVSKTRMEHFTWKNEPDMFITDAIVASCTIPFCYKAFIYNGDKYVDGARGDICPLDYAIEYNREYGSGKLLCITFKEHNCDNFIEFMTNLLVTRNITLDTAHKYENDADIVFLPNKMTSILLDKKERLLMFNNGIVYIRELLEKQDDNIAFNGDNKYNNNLRNRKPKYE